MAADTAADADASVVGCVPVTVTAALVLCRCCPAELCAASARVSTGAVAAAVAFRCGDIGTVTRMFPLSRTSTLSRNAVPVQHSKKNTWGQQQSSQQEEKHVMTFVHASAATCLTAETSTA